MEKNEKGKGKRTRGHDKHVLTSIFIQYPYAILYIWIQYQHKNINKNSLINFDFYMV